MAALTSLVTCFCAGEDSWLACSNNLTKNSGSSDTKDSNGRSRRNKHKRRINGDNTKDTAINAGFRGSKPGQQKKSFKRNTLGPSNLDRILDRSCQIHGTPEKPGNHTNRDCWVFKQAGNLTAENNDKGLHIDDEEDSNYLTLSEDEVSLGNEDFIVPEEPLEQECFKRRLIATATNPR